MGIYTMEISNKVLENAKKWKAVGEEYNLKPNELREIIYYLEQINKISKKSLKKG